MTVEIRNPAKLPTELYPAEEYFVHCLAEGKICTVGNGQPPGPAERIETGNGANMVRSEVIRFFVYGGDLNYPICGMMIELQGAWIPGKLDLMYARCPYALKFSKCRFLETVNVRQTECVALYLEGTQLDKGLLGDGLVTSGGVFMRYEFQSCGKIRLRDAHIGGDLSCTGGIFRNPEGVAINAERMQVGGHVFLNKRKSGSVHANNDLSFFSAEGEVRLQGAHIGGDLNCVGGVFKKRTKEPSENAITADHMQVRRVFFEDVSIDGQVRMRRAHISGHLNCVGQKKHASEKSSINLASATMGILESDEHLWASFDEIDIDGLTYKRFDGNFLDPGSCLKWLEKQKWRKDGSFAPQPYEQAANALFRMEHVSEAREILLEKERKSTMHGQWAWWHRPFRLLWGICAGYGYRLSYTAVWMAFFIVVGAVIFDAADARRRIAPTQVIVQANPDYGYAVKSHDTRPTDVVPEIFPGYAEFTPLAYSLDVFIPFFILQQESAWIPASGDSDNVWKPSIMLALAIVTLMIFAFAAEWIQRRCEGPRGRACAYAGILGVFFAICCYFSNWLFGDWWWLTVWYWLEIIAGWILTSLFLLSVTGLLRPRQSSGEKN